MVERIEWISILPGVRGGRSVKEVNIPFSPSNGCRALLSVGTPLGCVLPSNALNSGPHQKKTVNND